MRTTTSRLLATAVALIASTTVGASDSDSGFSVSASMYRRLRASVSLAANQANQAMDRSLKPKTEPRAGVEDLGVEEDTRVAVNITVDGKTVEVESEVNIEPDCKKDNEKCYVNADCCSARCVSDLKCAGLDVGVR